MTLSRLGHECVFASEIDPNMNKLYLRDFLQIKEKFLVISENFEMMCPNTISFVWDFLVSYFQNQLVSSEQK